MQLRIFTSPIMQTKGVRHYNFGKSSPIDVLASQKRERGPKGHETQKGKGNHELYGCDNTDIFYQRSK